MTEYEKYKDLIRQNEISQCLDEQDYVQATSYIAGYEAALGISNKQIESINERIDLMAKQLSPSATEKCINTAFDKIRSLETKIKLLDQEANIILNSLKERAMDFGLQMEMKKRDTGFSPIGGKSDPR